MDLLQRFITIQDRSILVSSALFPFFLKKVLYVLLLSRTIIYNKEDWRQLHCKDAPRLKVEKPEIANRITKIAQTYFSQSSQRPLNPRYSFLAPDVPENKGTLRQAIPGNLFFPIHSSGGPTFLSLPLSILSLCPPWPL